KVTKVQILKKTRNIKTKEGTPPGPQTQITSLQPTTSNSQSYSSTSYSSATSSSYSSATPSSYSSATPSSMPSPPSITRNTGNSAPTTIVTALPSSSSYNGLSRFNF
ncbi:6195_t:CDS:2, partial [Cetraspora pellucida]